VAAFFSRNRRRRSLRMILKAVKQVSRCNQPAKTTFGENVRALRARLDFDSHA
jgi:hypothetical protein